MLEKLIYLKKLKYISLNIQAMEVSSPFKSSQALRSRDLIPRSPLSSSTRLCRLATTLAPSNVLIISSS